MLTDNSLCYLGKLSVQQEQTLVAHLNENLYPDAKSICACA